MSSRGSTRSNLALEGHSRCGSVRKVGPLSHAVFRRDATGTDLVAHSAGCARIATGLNGKSF